MKLNEPTIRIRIQTRSQTHDLRAAIEVHGLTDERFWNLIKSCQPNDPGSFLTALQAAIQEEKQRILGKPVTAQRENNPSNIRALQEGDKPRPDRGDTGESGETYDAEAEYAALQKERKALESLPLGLGIRRVSRETGFYEAQEAGS